MGIARIALLLVNFTFTLIGLLLGLRIILLFFGASTQAPFVRWVYETSDSIIAPFAGIFPTTRLEGGFVLDFSAIFALVIYVFIGYLIIEAIETISARSEDRARRRK